LDVRLAPPAPVLFGLGVLWSGVTAPDPGLLLWSSLLQPEPAQAILNRIDSGVCDGLVTRVKQIEESRKSLDPTSALAGDIPAEWTAMLTETWPSDVPPASSLVALAVHLLRLWAQWLRGFSHSSVPYLLRQAIRRPGSLDVCADKIAVTLRPASLDPVLEMSGYLAPTPAVPWLSLRSVSFGIGGRRG
jgi:hypothetical protein